MSIISAAEHGYSQQVEALLAEGHSVHKKGRFGGTALFWAACRGHTKICSTLLKANARPNDCVDWGSTALHVAVEGGHTDTVSLLIECDAKVNVQNKRGDTPLHLACFNGYTDITKILLQHNADIFIMNGFGKSPFLEADCQKNLKVLHILTKHIRRLNCTAIPDHLYRYDEQYLSRLPICQFATFALQQPSSTSSSTSSSSSSSSSAQSNSDQNSHYISGRVPTESNDSNDIFLSNGKKNIDAQQTRPMTTIQKVPQESNQSLNSCNRMSECHLNTIETLTIKLTEEKKKNEDLLIKLNAYEQEISTLNNLMRNLSLQHCRSANRDYEGRGSTISDSASLHPECSITKSSEHLRNSSDVSSISKSLKHLNIESSPQVEGTCPTNNNAGGGTCASGLHSRSHKILLQICQQSTDFIPDILKQHLISNWVCYPHKALIKDYEKTEWFLDVNYTLRDAEPLNGMNSDCLEGTCSLIFRIKYNQHNLVLKMLLNILEMNEYGHNQGLSLQNALHHRFGPECLPSTLPLHRNIIQILHNYMGSTLRFQGFQHYFIPSDINGLESAYKTQFLILHQYPTTLKKFTEDLIIEPDQFETFFLQVLYQLLHAVDFLQRHYVVHRDIKADNIFLNCFLQPVLADFGFSRKLRGGDQDPLYPDSLEDIKCANPYAWAPELIRWNNGFDRISLKDVTLEEIYRCSDTYAIGRMFYGFFMLDTQTFPNVASLKPHYSMEEIPALQVPPALSSILQQLVLDLPSERLTAREAMLRIGCLLYPPSAGDVKCRQDVGPYLQAKMLSLLSFPPPNVPEESMYGEEMCSIAESIQINRDPLEAIFLSTVTEEEFWEVYQAMAPHIATRVT